MIPATDTRAIMRAIAHARAYTDSWIPVTGDVAIEPSLDAVLNQIKPALFHDHPDVPAIPDDTTVIDITSPDYPDRLRALTRRPLLLFVQGHLPNPQSISIAIVGTRHPTTQAHDDAYHIAAAVASAGHPVISGLAKGIDTAAHEGALSVGGVTVAVMGTGPDIVFPAPNRTLVAEIKTRGGAAVTQFAPGQGPSKTTFPARNKIIAGLSDVSLLIELNERSGTRIEAEAALEQSKPVWLWGPILRTQPWTGEFAQREGVDFVDSIDHILDRLKHLATVR